MTIHHNNKFLNSFKYFKERILKNSLNNKENLKKQIIININDLCYIEQIDKNKNFFFKKSNPGFENEFNDLRRKIFQYINDSVKENYLIPSNTRVYIAAQNSKNEILLARQRLFNYYAKQMSKNLNQYQKKYLIYETSYLERVMNNEMFYDLSREFRVNFIKTLKKYDNLNNKEYILMRYFIKKKQSIKPILIVLGFLEKSDAIIYKKQIYKDNFSFSIIKKKVKIEDNLKKNKKILIILLNKIKKYFLTISKIKEAKLSFLQKKIILNFIKIFRIKKLIKNNSEFLIEIKSTSLSGIKNSLNIFNNLKKTKFLYTFLLVPKFFNSNKIYKQEGFNYFLSRMLTSNKIYKQEEFNYFPSRMLTKAGFKNIPIYKTKQIEKKLLFSSSINSKKIIIPSKYLKTKTFFITLNKYEYQKLAKKDKKKLFFYEEEKEFTGKLKNLIHDQNKNLLNQFLEILLKIKNKVKTIEKLKLIKEFLKENYYQNNLLEKTNFYIDKINKN